MSNYNPVLLKAWEANLNIQSVYNYHNALTHMTAYFSKSKSEVSEPLKLAQREIKKQSLNVHDAVKQIVYSFIIARQLSVQESVYDILPELWLRKCLPGFLFINTNLLENRIRMVKSKGVLEALSGDSTDAFK